MSAPLRAARAALAWLALAVLAGSGAALAWASFGPVRTAAAPEGACAELETASNGWHTDIVFEAALLARDHPIRRLYPNARRFSVGWGERDAYRFGGAGEPWRHAAAIIPPRGSVLHIAADPGWRGAPAAVSAEGAAAFAAFLAREMRLSPDGTAIFVSPGYVAGRSSFVEGSAAFHAFNICNHWTARALAAAGLPVSDLGAWTAASVTRQVSRAARCPR